MIITHCPPHWPEFLAYYLVWGWGQVFAWRLNQVHVNKPGREGTLNPSTLKNG